MLTEKTENPQAENQENPAAVSDAHPIDDLIRGEQEKMAATAAEPLKRKRGRPRKIVTPDPAPVQAAPMDPLPPMAPPPDYRPMLKDLAAMGSVALVDHFATDAAALNAEEQERISESLNPLMQKWFPTMGEMTPEWAAIIGLSSVAFAVGMRIRKERASPPPSQPSQGQAA